MKKIIKFVVLFCLIIVFTLVGLYFYFIKSHGKNEKIVINITEGETYSTIGDKLKDSGLIKSKLAYKIYIKLNKPKSLEHGDYILNKSNNLIEIIETMEKGSVNLQDTKTITFVEGKNMRYFISKITSEFSITEEEILNKLKDEEYLDTLINKYWFLTDSIKNKDLYYSLEGYLYPATYEIDKTKDVKTIFAAMLDKMNTELTKYKEDIEKSNYTVHELLTLASIVELEAGNASDRGDVAGVFNNRVKNNWTLGSDVTTYYALKIDDFTYSLTNTELATCNKYNTRSTCFNGLPVGPISNPGDESIKASIYPTDTKAYYFVADCSGKTYLSSTYNEHNNIINKLKRENNWCQ